MHIRTPSPLAQITPVHSIQHTLITHTHLEISLKGLRLVPSPETPKRPMLPGRMRGPQDSPVPLHAHRPGAPARWSERESVWCPSRSGLAAPPSSRPLPPSLATGPA